jgi:hypothetical protein
VRAGSPHRNFTKVASRLTVLVHMLSSVCLCKCGRCHEHELEQGDQLRPCALAVLRSVGTTVCTHWQQSWSLCSTSTDLGDTHFTTFFLYCMVQIELVYSQMLYQLQMTNLVERDTLITNVALGNIFEVVVAYSKVPTRKSPGLNRKNTNLFS